MFYRMYLSSVCQRRQWSEPLYEPYHKRNGYFCKVVVNNREYCTDVPYETEDLARDGAAMKAFMICRNFSSNDGYYPGSRPGQRSANGVVQGVPVPIGSGRRVNRISASSYDGVSEGTSSGGNSPKSIESGFETQLRQATPHMPKPVARPQHDEYICLCRRAPVQAYGRCGWCLRESGWA
ncbi:CAAX farnesyltransferase (FTase) subunit beta [Extremus antarcticus]|uniref:CAAX farnesyltransferase (FTase) subunit beta n=1 Tax=Extremus antarcticus TaxID=702011 RepID=A0AAJ0DNX7_9PEZI|nr:CAAX farnesyltransferase (FTase) subunit beta [Extremus antarcticus]